MENPVNFRRDAPYKHYRENLGIDVKKPIQFRDEPIWANELLCFPLGSENAAGPFQGDFTDFAIFIRDEPNGDF